MKKAKTIYYNEHGQIDNFTTFINNNGWLMPIVFILGMLLAGIVEGF